MATSSETDARADQGTHGSRKVPTPERRDVIGDDTDAPSISPFSLLFLKLGLPAIGYVMLLTEVIPSFVYLALSHFHIGDDEQNAWLWFNNNFYAVLFAIPSSFMISVLSDGHTYGKFIACIIMLTLMFITGLSSLLETVQGLNPTVLWVVDHMSPYSMFVFYVTLPIRATIFTDVFAKHRAHEHARKVFAALWVCNLTGVCILIAVYQHYFEKDNSAIHFELLMILLVLSIVYFLVTVMILMTLPLELPLKNQFIYHLSIIWFALRHQPPRYLRPKNFDWLEPALEKHTQTEVKRTRSLTQLLMLVFPIVCYSSSHAYIYYLWYSIGQGVKWFGPMTYAYNCMYAHVLLTIVFIIILEAVVIPTLYHCWRHFNGIWLLLVGYLLSGIPLISLVIVEYQCSIENMTRFNAPNVRIINGYPERILLYSDWLGPDKGKGRASIPPGEMLTVHPPENAVGAYGEATIFAYPSIKVTDFIVMEVQHGYSSTYFLSPFHHDHVELRDYDIRRAPEIVLYGAFLRRKGHIIISCSPEFYEVEVELKCTYDSHAKSVVEMPVEHLCKTKAIHNGVRMEFRPNLTMLHWPARVYSCSIADDILTIEFEMDEYVLLHLTTHFDPDTESRVSKRLTFHSFGDRFRDAFLISTNLNILHCEIPYGDLVVQLVAHALSTALMLVSVYTVHCLHGPPRMRMTAYGLSHIGVYIGMCLERGVLRSRIAALFEAIIFDVVWAIGFVALTLIAVCCRFELHSWDIHWRPSIFWKVRAWLRIRLHHRWMVKEKAPRLQVDTSTPGSVSSSKGILQHDVIKDKTIDDDKSDRKVTFSEVEQ